MLMAASSVKVKKRRQYLCRYVVELFRILLVFVVSNEKGKKVMLLDSNIFDL